MGLLKRKESLSSDIHDGAMRTLTKKIGNQTSVDSAHSLKQFYNNFYI